MAGYQEMVTDPSYRGQILVLTAPLIGNYGVNDLDIESSAPQVEGLLVKEYCRKPRSQKAQESLGAYLDQHNIIGVEGIDTRSLTLRLRRAGTMTGVVSTLEDNPELLRQKVLVYKQKVGRDLVGEVSCPAVSSWRDRMSARTVPDFEGPDKRPERHILIYDFGVKYSILRRLAERGCQLTVMPRSSTASAIRNLSPDGVLLSNGPGDPVDQSFILPEIRSLLGEVPIFGICLGHQILALALGFSTYKLTFGHRGSNHPVKDLATGKVEITSQNHGYCVKLEQQRAGTVPTHLSLNDGTMEGLENRELHCFSVQYHPEASPGPRDSTYLFDKFVALVDEKRCKGGAHNAEKGRP